MATVYRKKVNGKFQSPYYYAVYYLANGKRYSKSTGLKTKREAHKLAYEWEQEEEKARKRGADRKEAKSPTLKRFLTGWLSNRELHIAPSTYESYVGSIRSLYEVMGSLADTHLSDLTTADLEWIQRSLLHTAREKKTKMRTLNYKMSLLKSAVTDAYNKGLIHRNIGLAVKDLPEDDSTLKAPFTKEEIVLGEGFRCGIRERCQAGEVKIPIMLGQRFGCSISEFGQAAEEAAEEKIPLVFGQRLGGGIGK